MYSSYYLYFSVMKISQHLLLKLEISRCSSSSSLNINYVLYSCICILIYEISIIKYRTLDTFLYELIFGLKMFYFININCRYKFIWNLKP